MSGDDSDSSEREFVDGTCVSRRRLLGGVGAAVGLAGAAATDRLLLGYGSLSGTNITEQSVSDLMTAPFGTGTRETAVPGGRLQLSGDHLVLVGTDGERRRLSSPTPRTAAAAAERLGIDPSPVRDAVEDVGAIRRGEARFHPVRFDQFSRAVGRERPRPVTTGLLRAPHASADPDDVWGFLGGRVDSPTELLRRLTERFRETTAYDLGRFAGNAVENRLPGDHPRRPLEASSFSALESDAVDGLLCWDYTRRAAEAVHAVPVADGAPAAAAAPARDHRHGHVFLALAAVSRGRGAPGPTVVVTFVEFVHPVLYDDLGLRGALGSGLNAYDRLHRVSRLPWWDDG